MNEIMSYEQLEKLAKNPYYKLSEEQLQLLETYRKQKYLTFKHPQQVKKHETELKEQ